MILNSYKALALIGYIVISNGEIHARQIKWIDVILHDEELDLYKNVIYDILNNTDEKTSYNDALEKFRMESQEVKEKIVMYCYQLAMIDGSLNDESSIDSNEKHILDDLIQELNLSDLKKLISKSKQILKKKEMTYKANRINEFDLNINDVLKNAYDDFENSSDVIKDLTSKCELLYRKLSNMNIVKNPKLKQSLQDFEDYYQSNILAILHQLKDNLVQKEVASQNISLALMGRTKAGKSTLHYIMCGEGEEFIGKGCQRTTRFNRVFSWNGLKIIDTPGIGAGADEGKQDTELAYSVIPQADIICFVVADDTITEESLNALNDIAHYHKPMIIVLNHKEDINKKSHQKKFENNPTRWMETNNEQRLTGWIDRLERNAEKNQYKEIMKVVPIFLLATQIGIEKEEKKSYLDASNYPNFIKLINELLSQNALLYKAQTMLDEPSVRLHDSLSSLETEYRKLVTFKDKLVKIQDNTTKDFAIISRDFLQKVDRFIGLQFEDFFNITCNDFIQENLHTKDITALKSSYSSYLEKSGVFSSIENETESYLQEYRNKISEKIKELEEEIHYANLNIANTFTEGGFSDLKKSKNQIPIKGILKGVEMILDIAALIHPIAGIVSFVVAIIGNFFKSNKQKENKTMVLMENNLKKLVATQSDAVKSQMEKNLKQMIEKDKQAISSLFEEIFGQINSVITYIDQFLQVLRQGTKQIDTFYAIRILEFISDGSFQKGNFEYSDIVAYRNIETRSFEIMTKSKAEFKTDKIKQITGEKISVKKYS